MHQTSPAEICIESSQRTCCKNSRAAAHQRYQPNDWEVLLILARTHPCLGWLYISPTDTRQCLDRLLRDRDAALEVDPNFSGMPQSFIDWTWQTWLLANLHRYEQQVEAHILYLDSKIGTLNSELEKRAGGVLDDRDAAADLRDRLQRQLDAREMAS